MKIIRPLPLLAALGLLLALGVLAANTTPTSANPDATLALGTSEIPEGDDFATLVLGMPWDMETGPYPGFQTVTNNIARSSFSVTNGVWNMTATNGDPNLFMLWPSIVETQQVLKLGDRYPIDASKYKLISLRLCSSKADFLNFHWWHNRISPPGNPDGISGFVDTINGCKTLAVNMETIEKIQGNWNGLIKGLRIDPSSSNPNLNFQLDWVRVTPKDLTKKIPITWSGATQGAALHFYISATACGVDGTLIGIANSAGRNGTFDWGETLQKDPAVPAQRPWVVLPIPESFEPGQYFIYMRENGSGASVCAGDTLRIHKAPILNFQKPSMFSGRDYAAEVVKDPWGMANSQDIKDAKGFSSLSFSNSLLLATNSGGDPRLTLNTTASIDADIYKYATFRLKINGEQSIGSGWVQRFVWWYHGPAVDPVVTQDMILHEGWHTYSIDLTQALIESGSRNWTDNPKGFRLDPHEITTPTNLELDFLTLTRDELVNRGTPFAIVYETTPGTGVSVNFYRDTDKNPANGRTPLTPANTAVPQISAGSSTAFLPLVSSGSAEIDLLTGSRWLWDTGDTPPGTYYISADVSTGDMTTTWYSEIPVIVR